MDAGLQNAACMFFFFAVFPPVDGSICSQFEFSTWKLGRASLYPSQLHNCKDNTSQDHFRSVNVCKEFAYRSEIEYIGTATTTELVTRSAERKSQQRVKCPETPGKPVSVVDANA